MILTCMKTLLRGLCATRESTKAQCQVLIQLQELLEKKGSEVKDLEKLLKEVLRLTRELRKDLVQVETKLAMHDATLAGFWTAFEVSRNGVLLWEINGYKEKKQEAISGLRTSFYSEGFYSDPHGYLMCARVYLNGDGVGKQTHLSVFFAIKKGKFDDILKWPFGLRVQFSLLHQNGGDPLTDAFRPDPNSSSFKKPTRESNIASGCPMFASQQDVENGGYLKNDKIWIKVTVGQ